MCEYRLTAGDTKEDSVIFPPTLIDVLKVFH
jgi:hypothetical protein